MDIIMDDSIPQIGLTCSSHKSLLFDLTDFDGFGYFRPLINSNEVENGFKTFWIE